MTQETSIIVPYSLPSSSVCRSWVKLEQIVPKELAKYATIRDLYDLWLAASTGESAQLIGKKESCPVSIHNGVISLWIDFFVWLSDPKVNYSLSAGIGTFGEKQQAAAHKAFSMLVNNVSALQLPFYFDRASTSFSWESPTYDRAGNQIFNVEISLVNGHCLHFSEEVFGVVRVSGEAVGYKERLTIEVDKGEDTEGKWVEYTLTDFNVDITVTTAEHEEVMHLTDATLPECINTLLSMCPEQENIDMCENFSGVLGKLLRVYFNSCTGEVLHVALLDMRNSKYCK